MQVSALLDRRNLTVTALVLFIVGMIGLIIWEYSMINPRPKTSAYFTIDDGKTVFVESNTKLAPFEKDGKQAVLAHVFICDGKKVVGYLSRYKPHSIEILSQLKDYVGKGYPPPFVKDLPFVGTIGKEIKRPGDSAWVSPTNSAEGVAISMFKCPNGLQPEEILP